MAFATENASRCSVKTLRVFVCDSSAGPNGAGKTTTLSILSGLLKADSGEAVVAGADIATNRVDAYRRMGFCPQFDSLWDLMTGYEHLMMYSMIKGVELSNDESVRQILAQFALEPYQNQITKGYSGGTKRKLSAGIAVLSFALHFLHISIDFAKLVGNPKIIFLDEPSTGMDPATRRFMWNAIADIKRGRAVVLTTHSMEEADALADRVGIMALGELQCIGSSQHLKNKYGRHFRITLSDVPGVQEWMKRRFDCAPVPGSLGKFLVFEIAKENNNLIDLFSELERAKKEIGFPEYVVSQTTLEQVFLQICARVEENAEESETTAV